MRTVANAQQTADELAELSNYLRARYPQLCAKVDESNAAEHAITVLEMLHERADLAKREVDDVYDGPETANGSALAMIGALLDGEPNAIHVARGRAKAYAELLARLELGRPTKD